MLMTSNIATLGILTFLCIIISILLKFVLSKKNKKQLHKIFIILLGLILFWMLSSILQIICITLDSNINPIYFDYFAYIGVCFTPVVVLLLSLIFARTKIKFNMKYGALFIIPTLSIILLWTNNFHHLFYKEYSIIMENNVVGPYFYIHQYYTLLLYIISLFIFVKYAIKNSGIFSRQAILMFIGALIPIITNILGDRGIVQMSVYMTPTTFAITIICIALALFKFSFLKATPIALQRIVDRISDSYIVLNENYEISDFNQTFINTFHIEKSSDIRGKEFETLLKENNLDENEFKKHIEKIKNNDKTETFELYINKIKKYFNIEITSIIVNDQFLGILVLFKDISQHVKDMKILKDNQDSLMESERLASLGQLIGGIAHNLKTPIMSIAGAAEGLTDLVKEYEMSIGNPNVNNEDHHAIAADMSNWIAKIKDYTEYMSDIITAVKGQAVNLSETENISFDLEELVKRIDILMKHELKNAIIYLNVHMHADSKLVINGDVNSLVQVINNMISNSIQAYAGRTEETIDLDLNREGESLIISITDHASGLPKKVKDKLFKEMVTTKGKNGTGLGLYMSYSTIKANFGGNITFESEEGKGTKFNIILPIN